MLNYALLVILIFAAIQGQAQTLLVSDVDDTLKLSYTQNYKGALYFSFDTQSRFMGMSDLYHKISENNQDLKIVYLSRAPQWLMKKNHEEFLANGHFPAGEYIGRENLSSESHKLVQIRSLIQKYQPKKVLLIGDNGEADPQVYKQIASEFKDSDIRFYQFIRIVYSKSFWNPVIFGPEADQIGFVTPLEISLELEKENILNPGSVHDLVQTLGPDLANENLWEKQGSYAFPYFVECSDFRWQWEEDLKKYPELISVKKRIFKRCGL